MVVDNSRRFAASSPSLRAATRARELDAADEILRLRMELAAQTQRVETLTQLAGTVAHDFNNVLMAISAGVTLAARRIDDPVATDRLDDIRDAVRTGASLASQMTCLLRSHHVTTLQRVHVDSVVRQMRSLLAALVGKRISLTLELGARPASFETHPAYLQQILLNLVLNARDAMPDGGTIRITTRLLEMSESPVLQITVSDDGEGISSERREEIFRPFATSKADRGGTGLGLFIVRTLAEELRGQVEVCSEVGVGTSFAVTLPCDCSLTDDDVTPTKVIDDRDHSGGRTILLVEDDRAVHTSMRKLLESDGHSVWSARCALEAEKVLDTGVAQIDVILTEAILPDGTGSQLGAFARERRPNVTVVYMSGHSREDLVARSRLHDDAAFLQKPFSSDELLRRLAAPRRTNSRAGAPPYPIGP